MDVATLVKNITSAFEDASTLVKRIRERKEEEEQNVNTEPIDDLLDSLSLGPTVVRGYYESDAKRFGSIYMAGDAIAREQLKDCLISLQMIVLSGLRTVILDDKDPDYESIQCASDDCRVNVGVCLGQLSQRMSKAAKGFGSPGRPHAYENVPIRSLQRSNTDSTQSSGHIKPNPMTPPESDTEYLGDMARQGSGRRQNFTARAPDLDVMDGMHSSSYSGLYSSATDAHNNNAQQHFQRSSTGNIQKPLESPISPQDFLNSPVQRFRDSSVSTSSSRGNYPIAFQTQLPQDDPNSAPRSNYPPSWGYFESQPQTQAYNNDFSELTSATLGKTQMSNLMPINRKPVSSPTTLQPNPLKSAFHRNSIPEEDDEKEVCLVPPIPTRSDTRSGSYPIFGPDSVGERLPHYDTLGLGGANGTHVRSMSASMSSGIQNRTPYNGNTSQRTELVQRRSTGPLNLPTEKNLLGLCKGAFRLQAGMDKKAFNVANRPLGYASMLQYWKCDKCQFEGQLSTIIPPGGKKPEKTFDPVIRDYGGIRYKWVFLAKCHVPLKSMVEGKRDGLYGSFCCIFCTAEAAQRGWPTNISSLPSDRASIRSSTSNGSNSGTLVFGNLHGLMDHLEMHRHPDFWPGVEMQGRMKCVVGRVAPRGEDFDINLLPLP